MHTCPAARANFLTDPHPRVHFSAIRVRRLRGVIPYRRTPRSAVGTLADVAGDVSWKTADR
jgi:hypothetical protein